LVALPTETVYGLGADAFNPNAVANVYATKGRPGDNPLILHIADKTVLDDIAADIPAYAHALADKFWPGPLTLVVRKKKGLPDWLGGHPQGVGYGGTHSGSTTQTVGVRVSAHPVMQSVIRESGCIIAAPSANVAGKPSPTCAAHIVIDYESAELTPDLLLDGGTVDVGVESTVVDVTASTPIILRHGVITAEMIYETIRGIPQEAPALPLQSNDEPNELDDLARNAPRAPGMKYRHYAPVAPMTLLSGSARDVASYITTQIVSEIDAHIGVMVSSQVREYMDKTWPLMAVQTDAASLYTPLVSVLPLGDDLPDIARNLFANLRRFDELGVDIILAEALETDGMGAAIMDRMTKAAEGRIMKLGVNL